MPNIKLTSLQCITRGVRMNHVGSFSLLLLICRLPGAELQDTEMTEHGKQSPKSLNVADQSHPCLSDIHAVLREMSATLAEQRVKIEQLQTENQEHGGRNWRQVPKVAFSASLSAAGAITLGPFSSLTTLVYKHVISNIGNAYNPLSGFFTAPVKGAYHFEFYICVNGPELTSVLFVKNEVTVASAYEHQQTGFGSASNGVTLILEAGDAVYVRLSSNQKIYDNDNHHSTFSGHLLFTM